MGKKDSNRPAQHLKVPMAAPNMRIGLLGGSFNPAHAAHRQISLAALKRLGLDQVWWLVSPGNPLKDAGKMPDLEARIEVARGVARHPKIVVTGFEGARAEAARRSAYTVDTIRFLKRRYPSVDFVWLMGADNLASFHRWREWEKLFGLVPIAVLDRPGYRLKARASRAAQRFAFAALDESDARGLASMDPPAWTLLSLPLSSLSSTRLRAGMEGEPPRAKTRKAAKAVKKLGKEAKKAAKKQKKDHAEQAKKDKKDTKKSKKAAKRH
jgi:nicotinate-nucleotide adenylyltransferase